jgi:hypothetical protein
MTASTVSAISDWLTGKLTGIRRGGGEKVKSKKWERRKVERRSRVTKVDGRRLVRDQK